MANLMQRNPLFGNLSRFDPFFDDDWLKGFGMRPFMRDMVELPQIRIDLSENDKSYTVRAEIPGMKKEDIKVQIDGNRVSISTEIKQEKEEKKGEKVICRECYQGASYRSFTLEHDVDDANAQAKYDNGVLELTLPKKSNGGAKQLQVK